MSEKLGIPALPDYGTRQCCMYARNVHLLTKADSTTGLGDNRHGMPQYDNVWLHKSVLQSYSMKY